MPREHAESEPEDQRRESLDSNTLPIAISSRHPRTASPTAPPRREVRRTRIVRRGLVRPTIPLHVHVSRPRRAPLVQFPVLTLIRIPPNVRSKVLLSRIRGGRVYSLEFSDRPEYAPWTAKLIFFEPEAANGLYRRCQNDPAFLRIGSYVIDVEKKNELMLKPEVPADHTRILWIDGPTHVMDSGQLDDLFERNHGIPSTPWDMEDVVHLPSRAIRHNLIKWSFNSYEKGALVALNWLRNAVWAWPGILVEFAPDHCAEPWE